MSCFYYMQQCSNRLGSQSSVRCMHHNKIKQSTTNVLMSNERWMAPTMVWDVSFNLKFCTKSNLLTWNNADFDLTLVQLLRARNSQLWLLALIYAVFYIISNYNHAKVSSLSGLILKVKCTMSWLSTRTTTKTVPLSAQFSVDNNSPYNQCL